MWLISRPSAGTASQTKKSGCPSVAGAIISAVWEGRCVHGVSQPVPGGGKGPKKQPLRPIVIERLLIPSVGPPVNPGR